MDIRDLLQPTDQGLIALSALLLEMAHIDGEFSEEEAVTLIDILSHELAQSIVRGEALLVRAQGLLIRIPDIDALAAQVREEFAPEERAAVIGLLWQIALADGRVDQFENYFAKRMASLLEVSEEAMRDELRHAAERMQDR